MLKVHVLLKGVTPILMNNGESIDEDSLNSGTQIKKVKGTKDKEADEKIEVEKKMYKLADGRLYVPTINIRAAYIQGCGSSYKLGKGKFAPSLKNEMSGLIRAIDPEDCLLLTSDGKQLTDRDVVIDKRRGVNPNTGNAIIIKRPRINPPWELEFVIIFDDTRIDESALSMFEDVMKRAGACIGICDFRPGSPKNKIGWFGKFDVEKFEKIG